MGRVRAIAAVVESSAAKVAAHDAEPRDGFGGSVCWASRPGGFGMAFPLVHERVLCCVKELFFLGPARRLVAAVDS